MEKPIDAIRRELLLGKRISELPLRVTFYGRVSTEEVHQLDSLEHQIRHFEHRIRAVKTWDYVPGYIDEGITGTRKDKRPAFLKMIQDARAGAFDLILTKEVSRFARDIVDCVQTVRELLKYNVGVLFEDINLNTLEADAEFRLSIMAIVAQEESRKISERVKFGYRQTMKDGKRHGAAPPMGYCFHNENNGYRIDEDRAPAVRYVFEEYAKGELGTRRIAKELARQGYFNRNGNPYSPSTLERMIRNPVYKGYVVNGKSHKPSYREDKRVMNPRDQWLLHYDPQRVPPLVSEGLWQRANDVLYQRSKRLAGIDCSGKDGKGLGKYAYSNRIRCTVHGCSYHRCLSRWRVGGVEKQAAYWCCSMYKKYGNKQCESPILYERDLECIMGRLFSGLIPRLQETYHTLLKSHVAALENGRREGVCRLEGQIAALERKKQRLLEGWMDNILSDAVYLSAFQGLEVQIEALKKRLMEERKREDNAGNPLSAQAVLNQALENANLQSQEILEELVRCFVESILVKRKENGEEKGEEAGYFLEIWLKHRKEPILFDFSLCERTRPSPGRRTGP